MNNLYKATAILSGGFGALLCVIAGICRILGYYHLAGYEAMTLFTAGTGLMVFACMLKLDTLLGQQRGAR